MLYYWPGCRVAWICRALPLEDRIISLISWWLARCLVVTLLVGSTSLHVRSGGVGRKLRATLAYTGDGVNRGVCFWFTYRWWGEYGNWLIVPGNHLLIAEKYYLDISASRRCAQQFVNRAVRDSFRAVVGFLVLDCMVTEYFIDHASGSLSCGTEPWDRFIRLTRQFHFWRI